MAQRPRSDNQLMKKSYNIYFKRHCSGEQEPALRNKKENFYFILFILLTAKVYQNSSLKIFALAACAYALFLLSANICQATFSVRRGLRANAFTFKNCKNSIKTLIFSKLILVS